jgi:UrcA family protein
MSFMSIRRMLATGAACATMAAGIGGVAHAQPYGPDYSYAPDQGSRVGEIVVRPSYRNERAYNGAEIVVARASRVVDVSDLDLSTDWGQRALYHRVTNAATDACNDLDNDYTMGLYPTGDDSDSDCIHRAVYRAMRSVNY